MCITLYTRVIITIENSRTRRIAYLYIRITIIFYCILFNYNVHVTTAMRSVSAVVVLLFFSRSSDDRFLFIRLFFFPFCISRWWTMWAEWAGAEENCWCTGWSSARSCCWRTSCARAPKSNPRPCSWCRKTWVTVTAKPTMCCINVIVVVHRTRHFIRPYTGWVGRIRPGLDHKYRVYHTNARCHFCRRALRARGRLASWRRSRTFLRSLLIQRRYVYNNM